jgi:hypothetical protein
MAILAVPLLFLAFLAMWSPKADAATGYAIYEVNQSVCIVANGGSIYTQGNCPQPASANHAALWYLIPEGTFSGHSTYEIKNVHDGLCITASSNSNAVYGATCGTNHVQFFELVPVEGNYGTGDELQNVHTTLVLAWDSSSSSVTQAFFGSGSNNVVWQLGNTGV